VPRHYALLAARAVELGVSSADVGIITLYRAQTGAITRALAALVDGGGGAGAAAGAPPPGDERIGDAGIGDAGIGDAGDGGGDARDVQVSTVDSFQGQEKEIIILSLCGGGGGAFITDERVNVALTRAKRHLIVLGDSKDPATRSNPEIPKR